MEKPLRRLTLRLTPDNPIFDIPYGERNKKAEELLRIGSSTERLENATRKLEKLINQVGVNGQNVLMSEPDIDKKKLQRDLKLIHSIMNLGGGNKN